MAQVKPAPSADQTQLALERTFLAHERTLMAWIRTAASLITFGFALYKFFFYMRHEEATRPVEHVLGARVYGLCMIGVGVLALALATWQHRLQMKKLRVLYPEAPFSLSLVLAALIAGLGILGFIGAIVES